MFLKRQLEPDRTEEEPAPEPFPPLQPPGQPDEDYRLALIDLIAGIDKTKRDIKAQIHSSAITAKAEKCSVDQVWLRRAKDKMDHLTREREEIRKALHTVNERIRETRRAANRPKDKARLSIPQAFLEVARERLPREVYASLMSEAHGRATAEEPPA